MADCVNQMLATHHVQGLAFHGITKYVRIEQHEDSPYRVLSNISGVIYPKQMMALMGLSGCGYVRTHFLPTFNQKFIHRIMNMWQPPT